MFFQDLKLLAQNPSYLCLTISFTFLYGIYTSIGSVVSQLTAPFGYSSTDNALFGAIFIFTGVIGSFIYGMILDRTAKYKLMLTIISISAVISISLTMITLPTGNVPLFSLNLLLAGVSIIPVIPVSYSFAVELTYPISEAMSNGMMIMSS